MHPIREELLYWKREAMERHRDKRTLEKRYDTLVELHAKEVHTLRRALQTLLSAYEKVESSHLERMKWRGTPARPRNLDGVRELLHDD